ncbi:hypothetical protein TIFTF001_043197 [Ficus carica]|uniref:Uncharacterized protein n=1 Tax=Ficus carica TaxID=3494 RepID=A0AA87YR44_FICCA|nr:hypothetical protein TIFTF001_043197 [Ficus carica]
MLPAAVQINCRIHLSSPVSGGPQISRRRQDEITNKSPIAMEKQRSRSLAGDWTFCVIMICRLHVFPGSVDDIAAAAAAALEALQKISPTTRRFVSSIAISRRRSRISGNRAMANALESFGMRSLAIWRRRQKQQR